MNDPVFVYSTGLCFASVCTSVDDEETAKVLNLTHPTGVTPWVVSDESFADGSPNPTPCPDDSDRRHVLFNC